MTSEVVFPRDEDFLEYIRSFVDECRLSAAAVNRLFALARRGAEAGKLLAEQDREYNRKTNDMIARHAEQLARRGAAAQWKPCCVCGAMQHWMPLPPPPAGEPRDE